MPSAWRLLRCFAMPTRFLIFFAYLPGYFFSYFLRSTNAVIANDLTRDLDLTASQLGLMTSLFFGAFAAAQLPIGVLLDRYGARIVTPALMLLAVLGCVMFGLGESFATVAVARTLIGIGVAGNLMGALKAFSGWFAPERFALASSLYLALGSLGALTAATPLALVSDAFGWRSVFFGSAGIVLLAAGLILWLGRDAPGTVDDAEQTGSEKTGPEQAGGFADIFRDLRFWRIALLNFAVVGSMFAYQSLWAGPFVGDVLDVGSVAVGNLLLVLSGGVTLGYAAAGVVGDRLGVTRVLVVAAGVFTLTQVGLTFFRPDWPAGSLTALFAAFSLSAAFAVLMFTQIRALFPLHLTGRAVTAMNLFGIGGSAVLQWGLGLLIEGVGDTQTGPFPPAAYSAAFGFTAALSLAALIFYAPMLRRVGGKNME